MNKIHDYESFSINNQTDKKLKSKEENMLSNQRSQEILIKGIFLAFLSILGNFLDTMLPCQTQYVLRTNPFIRQIVMFIVIYFVIDFSSTKVVNPTTHLLYSSVIYILFFLFTKSVLWFSIISILLLSINYIIGNYIKYYDFHNIPSHNLNAAENYINILIVINIVVGFIYYIIKQLREKKEFKWTTFFAGTIDCDSKNKQ